MQRSYICIYFSPRVRTFFRWVEPNSWNGRLPTGNETVFATQFRRFMRTFCEFPPTRRVSRVHPGVKKSVRVCKGRDFGMERGWSRDEIVASFSWYRAGFRHPRHPCCCYEKLFACARSPWIYFCLLPYCFWDIRRRSREFIARVVAFCLLLAGRGGGLRTAGMINLLQGRTESIFSCFLVSRSAQR